MQIHAPVFLMIADTTTIFAQVGIRRHSQLALMQSKLSVFTYANLLLVYWIPMLYTQNENDPILLS